MEEQEIINNLKEHILYCIKDHGKLTKFDRGWCTRYIMDFMFYDSADDEKTMEKKAKLFFEENIIKELDVPSEEFDGLKYIVIEDCVVVKTKDDGILCIQKKHITSFVKELKRIGEAV